VIALIDESIRFADRPTHYVVAAVMFAGEPSAIRTRIAMVVSQDPDRSRPFHWATEGTRARQAMVQCAHAINAVVHTGIYYPTGRRDQEQARAILLADVLLPQLLNAGVTELLIESRDNHRGRLGAQDARDLQTIRNYLRPWRGSPTFSWVGKDEPLLWIADAVAGAAREHADGTDRRWLEALVDAGVPMHCTWLGPDDVPDRKVRQPRLPS
jgi:hypothetical protein